MSNNRDVGIGFGDLQDDLETETYPIDTGDLLGRYGDRHVEHANGSVSLRELLEGESRSNYASAADVHQSVLNMVGDEAEGRKGYTDREPNATNDGYEPKSF